MNDHWKNSAQDIADTYEPIRLSPSKAVKMRKMTDSRA
jgi:hypothetical protein